MFPANAGATGQRVHHRRRCRPAQPVILYIPTHYTVTNKGNRYRSLIVRLGPSTAASSNQRAVTVLVSV